MATRKTSRHSKRSSWFAIDGHQIGSKLGDLLRLSVANPHHRIITLGLFVGLCYLPVWIKEIGLFAGDRSAGFFLLTIVALGGYEAWRSRGQISQLVASEEDQWLGYALIVAGAIAFPFCRFSAWSQAIIWTVVVAGIICSTWGTGFFKKHPALFLLFLLSVCPYPGAMLRLIWNFITPPDFLESGMAWAGGIALQAIGQSATTQGRFLHLPNGVVEVGWGCNGFTMALNTAGAGFLIGLFLKLPWHKTLALMLSGIALALIFNVPRIMVLAIAAVYWGKESFEFWHGPIGGQIFSAILLTVYYYAMMAVIQRKPKKVKN